MIAKGYCQCGCGEKAPIITESHPSRGLIKGEPHKYVCGHHMRSSPTEYLVNEKTGCWEWQRKTSRGYGRKRVNGKKVLAYKFYYEQKNGPVPIGFELDHICENKKCVNPDHLIPVTHAENVRRGKSAKLTWDKVEQIRERHLEPLLALSQEFNVSLTAISNVINYKTWV